MTGNEAGCPIQFKAKETYNPCVPHEVFAMLRRTQPVFWHQPRDGGPGFWAVLKYRDIVHISTNVKSFSSARGVFYEDIASGQGIPGSLLTSDPPQHTFLRSQVNEWFTVDAMDRLEPWLRKEAKGIMNQAAAEGGSEFVYGMAAKLPLLTICEFMGVPEQDRSLILKLSDVVMRSDSDVSFAAAMKEIGEYGLALAASASKEGKNSLVVDKLRSLRREGVVPEAEFANQFAQLIVAGSETTRTLLSNIVLEFCQHPEIFQTIKNDIDIIPQAIEEFLRWTTPLYYLRRTAVGDVELRGQKIKSGDPVVMYYVSANRDEEIFERPDVFDMTRKTNKHLAFGVGRHTCLGAQVARLETRVFLEEFVARFSSIELSGLPERFPSNSVNAWGKIPVRLTPVL